MNNNVISSPLNVNNYLNGLTKTAWNSSNEEITPTSDSAWYNYTAGQNKWANAKNMRDNEGSYFVWIPRYAYRITYLNDQNKPSGYFDGRGMVDLAGNIVTSANGATFTPRATSIIKGGVETSIMATVLDDGVNVVEYNGYQYIVHPAFETNLDLGGWSSDLPGFWCAKFEMSREDSSDSGANWSNTTATGNVLTKNAGNSDYIRAVSKPNVPSWRIIDIENCFLNSYNYYRIKESHLMKNSEWGAVAYLSYSQFGTSGQEISINNNKDYLTGYSGENTNSAISSESVNTYSYNETTYGVKAGSTGNIYGIYDLSGGAWEFVMGFCSQSDSLDVISISPSKNSTKYVTAYSNPTDYNSGKRIYEISKIGDALKEVYRGIYNNIAVNWKDDMSNFIYNDRPFWVRGRANVEQSKAGIFSSSSNVGGNNNALGFRIVLGL